MAYKIKFQPWTGKADVELESLFGANLFGADLSGADLSGVDLRGANLIGADLSGADLSGVDLRGVDLRGANLIGANLRGVNLRVANLRGANLSWAYLSGANLSGANLIGANLRGANLREANLFGADLSGADLSGASLPHFSICPESGSFIAYKKLSGNVIATLQIPKHAERTSSLVSRKCRASHVKVLSLSKGTESTGLYSSSLVYKVGELVYPDKYDPDIRVECTNGIHFFMTRREAKEFQM